jgi:hypothetical protein
MPRSLEHVLYGAKRSLSIVPAVGGSCRLLRPRRRCSPRRRPCVSTPAAATGTASRGSHRQRKRSPPSWPRRLRHRQPGPAMGDEARVLASVLPGDRLALFRVRPFATWALTTVLSMWPRCIRCCEPDRRRLGEGPRSEPDVAKRLADGGCPRSASSTAPPFCFPVFCTLPMVWHAFHRTVVSDAGDGHTNRFTPCNVVSTSWLQRALRSRVSSAKLPLRLPPPPTRVEPNEMGCTCAVDRKRLRLHLRVPSEATSMSSCS